MRDGGSVIQSYWELETVKRNLVFSFTSHGTKLSVLKLFCIHESI